MGILDGMLTKTTTAEPVDIPAFVPTDVSELSDRQLLELIHTKLETFEHMAKSFSLQAQAHPLLRGLAPKL